jgi:hypothetical protein
MSRNESHTISGEKLVFRCEECNRNIKNKKGLKTHRARIYGPMGQSFLCKIFSSKINKTNLKIIKKFQNLAPGIKICDRGSLSLLGSPIFDQGFKYTLEKTITTVENLLHKLLSRHVSYTE